MLFGLGVHLCKSLRVRILRECERCSKCFSPGTALQNRCGKPFSERYVFFLSFQCCGGHLERETVSWRQPSGQGQVWLTRFSVSGPWSCQHCKRRHILSLANVILLPWQTCVDRTSCVFFFLFFFIIYLALALTPLQSNMMMIWWLIKSNPFSDLERSELIWFRFISWCSAKWIVLSASMINQCYVFNQHFLYFTK